jgi:hypothetical protein
MSVSDRDLPSITFRSGTQRERTGHLIRSRIRPVRIAPDKSLRPQDTCVIQNSPYLKLLTCDDACERPGFE